MKFRISMSAIKEQAQSVFGRRVTAHKVVNCYSHVREEGVYLHFPCRTGESVEQCKARVFERLDQLPACDE